MSKKKNNSKKAWVKYLKNSKLTDWEVQKRAEWYSFHKREVPKS